MVMELIERMLKGEELSLARLITIVEREGPEVPEIMRAVQPHVGRAYIVGVTGPPGAGKSTLVDRLTALIRKQGATVGIIAVDPSSPFTGGAVLGDRIRMQQHYLDRGVFIRSMATRGSHGGLPRTTSNVVKLLDAFGKDFILIETVGVGQTELDIVDTADSTLVVLVPEAGDTIQTMKAGLLEISDIFVVNKADREGAQNLVTELTAMLRLYSRPRWWEPPVLATQAVNNVGIEELYRAILDHRKALEESGRLEDHRRESRRKEFLRNLRDLISYRISELMEKDGRLASYLKEVEEGVLDPYSASVELLQDKALIERWFRELA